MRDYLAIAWVAVLVLASAAGCAPASRSEGEPADTETETDTSSADSDTGDEVVEGVECEPGELWCYNNWVAQCGEDGDTWTLLEDCAEQGLVCAAGECTDTTAECADAINEKSYIGCEYWGVTLANKSLNYDPYGNPIPSEPFYYAVAIANEGEGDAEVQITDGPGGEVANDYTVLAGQMLVIQDLPWKGDIQEPVSTAGFYSTRKIANAAYHITSSLPVTAYQFNPLHYSSLGYYSYTNDASLLLPVHVYRDQYMVVTRATMKLVLVEGGDPAGSSYHPGFFAVVGSDEDPITISVDLTSFTLPSDAVSNATYGTLGPGSTMNEVVIEPFEVLQVLSGHEPGFECHNADTCGVTSLVDTDDYNLCCDTPPEYDLTGTMIDVVEGPNPAVFGGTSCSFVPFDKWACDHLEQQLFPLVTWGRHYLCAHHMAQYLGEPTIWRVVSGSDGNEITFTPDTVAPATTLDRGEYVEFQSLADFEVEGSGRVAVAQFMPGQHYDEENPALYGDPAYALAVPLEQYRTSYSFLTPDTYVSNYLTVIHEIGEFPLLDGSPVAGDTVEINDEFARTNLTITAGSHYIESDSPFGITVYGVGSFTSYMYPGGLDLAKVDVGVE